MLLAKPPNCCLRLRTHRRLSASTGFRLLDDWNTGIGRIRLHEAATGLAGFIGHWTSWIYWTDSTADVELLAVRAATGHWTNYWL